MSTTILDFTSPELPTALDANMVAFWRTYAEADGSSTGNDDGVLWFYTGIDYPLFNGAMGINLTPNQLLPIQDFLSRGIVKDGAQAIWWIDPDPKPEILDALANMGLTPIGETPAMAMDLAALEASPATPDLRIERAEKDPELRRVWARIAAQGTGLPDAAAESFEKIEARLSPADYESQRRYVGFLDDKPVAASAMMMTAGVIGIYAVATIPEARGKGIGRAMTALPMEEARQEGYRTATLQASSMGKSIYERMGFTYIGSYQLFLQTA